MITAKPEVVYEDSSFIAVNKPAGLPTVPLKGEPAEGTLLGEVALEYPEVLCVNGRTPWEGGVIHRLDTATGGLVLIARTDPACRFLMEAQAEERIVKDYNAFSSALRREEDGFPAFPYSDPVTGNAVTVSSLFRPYGEGRRQVRPVCESSSPMIRKKAGKKLYSTEIAYCGDGLFRCRIREGFRHQIRVHLAWSGHPIDGDSLYGGLPGKRLQLTAVKLTFPHPDSGKEFIIEL